MSPTPTLKRRIAAAVELRARGASWEQVAEKLGCRPGAPKRWRRAYPAFWAKAARTARRDRDEETDAESIATLRQMLRNEDDKLKRDAAKLLLARRRGRPARKAPAPADPLTGLTDDHLRSVANDPAPVPDPGGPDPGAC